MSSKLNETVFFQLGMVEYEVKRTFLKKEIFKRPDFGPLGPENLNFPKSSAENISKRKYKLHF